MLKSSFLNPPQARLAPQIIWQPQPGPQTALIECPIFEVFFGGARGGGKTESSLGDWLHHSSLYAADAIGIFVRRRYKQLSEVIARAKQLFKPLGAVWNEQRSEFLMPNGARLKFVYLERDSDAEEYQGHSYTRVYVEEIGNFPSYTPIGKLKATLRSAVGVPCGFRATGNPGGPGHQWVKARYIDPAPNGYKVITESEEIEIDGKTIVITASRVFIPSKIQDNKLLLRNDPGYLLRLKQSGSAALVKAWLEGDWNAIDGVFFDEWDPTKHILSNDWFSKIPANALRFRSFDWGSAAPFCCHWWALSDGSWGLPRDALVMYREWYGASGPNKGLKMNADLVAQGIVEREKGERIRYGVADPSIFIRNGGPSIAETMSVHRCNWRRGDNKRIPGAEQMHCRLHGHNDTPMLYVLECCEDFIRTVPYLQHDEKNEEDIDTTAEDHAYDAARYGIMSRPWHPRAPYAATPTGDKLPHQMTINELIKKREQAKAAYNLNI